MPSATFAVRKENLRRLVLDKFEGNRAALARVAEVHQNQINLLLSDNEEHRRNMGEALARRMEETLGLAAGWLDAPHNGAAGSITTILPWDVPAPMSHLVSGKVDVVSAAFLDTFLDGMKGSITGVENLALCRVTAHDMAPALPVDSNVMVDTAVKAVGNDGVYILQQGSAYFMRKVARNLTGGYTLSAGPDIEVAKVDSMKGLKVVARVVMVSRREML